MKLIGLAVTVGLLLTTMVAGQCRAQEGLKVNIPFAFVVGNSTLPAGEYLLRRLDLGHGSAEAIQQVDGSVSMMVLTRTADQNDQKTEPRLIFNQYGSQRFLSQIWTGAGSGRQLLKSKREKELALTGEPTEFALILPVASAHR